MGQIEMIEKVAACCLDRTALVDVALECVDVIPVRWDAAAGVSLLDQQAPEVRIRADTSGQPHRHAADCYGRLVLRRSREGPVVSWEDDIRELGNPKLGTRSLDFGRNAVGACSMVDLEVAESQPRLVEAHARHHDERDQGDTAARMNLSLEKSRERSQAKSICSRSGEKK